MNGLKRSDKFALFLVAALGGFFLFVAILGAMADAFNPGGMSILIQMWLRLSLIFILPLWLLMRAAGVIFAAPKDAPFIAQHSEHWRQE